MPKRTTNVQCVKQLMEFSKFGPLAQMFVMDALTKVSERVASTPIKELEEAFGNNGLISAEAWRGVAAEIKSKLDLHFSQ